MLSRKIVLLFLTAVAMLAFLPAAVATGPASLDLSIPGLRQHLPVLQTMGICGTEECRRQERAEYALRRRKLELERPELTHAQVTFLLWQNDGYNSLSTPYQATYEWAGQSMGLPPGLTFEIQSLSEARPSGDTVFDGKLYVRLYFHRSPESMRYMDIAWDLRPSIAKRLTVWPGKRVYTREELSQILVEAVKDMQSSPKAGGRELFRVDGSIVCLTEPR